MRPPTRSTRSTRLPSNKPTTNARGSRTSDPLTRNPAPTASTTQPKETQSVVSTAATVDTTNVDTATLPGHSDPSSTPPIVGYCSDLSTPPTKFVFENQKLELEYHRSQVHPQAQTSPAGSSYPLGKPPRSRHRMTSEKLETLDAFFRRNTHPSRKEKEAICKNLDMDLKTLTIWFQNKRQTVARSNRRQLESEGAGTTTTSPIATTAEATAVATATASIDMLASASATMSPLVATVTEKPSSESSLSAGQLDSGAGEPYSLLDQGSPASSQLLPATTATSSCVSTPKSRQLSAFPPRVPLSVAVAYDPNVSSPSPEIDLSTSAAPWGCSSSSSPERQRNEPPSEHNWLAVHPEDLWKHIPSSPAQPAMSPSPDVSPKIGAPTSHNKGTRHSLQRAPTLEWACARSAKRRRTKPDDGHFEDGETDSEWGDTVDRTHSTFRVSEARVPLECYDSYPLDIVRGAVLLLGLRDARGPGI